MIPTLALTEVTAARFLDRGRGDAAAARVAGRIVSDVRRRGEAALRAWTRRLDGAVPAGAFRVSPAEIARAAARAKAMGAKSISVDGHADRVGAADRNMKLSEKREAAVRMVLASDGLNIPVAGRAFGESRPPMATSDGKAEPTNRRVDIILNP